MAGLLRVIKPDRIYPIVDDAYMDVDVERRLRFPKMLTDLCCNMDDQPPAEDEPPLAYSPKRPSAAVPTTNVPTATASG